MLPKGQQDRQTVERFWQAMGANDFPAAAKCLDAEYVLEWPQSGERIRGRENFVAVNVHYPAAGPWRVTIHRLIADAGGVASEVTVTDGVITGRAITFFELRDSLIVRQTEYWPDPMAAAPWRAQWVERFP